MIQSREELVSNIIALSGWKGSGKDTVALYLEREYGYTRLSFAAILKDIVAETYNIPRHILDDVSKKEEPLMQYPVIQTDRFAQMIHNQLAAELISGYWTPRALCILEGSIKRSVTSKYWTSKVLSRIAANPHGRYVITDMRYQSEADSILSLFPHAALIRIHRFSHIDTLDPSERDLDSFRGFNATIMNDGTIEELYSRVDASLMGSRR